MHALHKTSLIALTIALAGCSGEDEGTPDITEAIPLDSGDTLPGGNTTGGDQQSPSGTPDLPGESNGTDGGVSGVSGSNSGAGSPRNRASSMESGSNPPDMTEPPEGSKVQRFN